MVMLFYEMTHAHVHQECKVPLIKKIIILYMLLGRFLWIWYETLSCMEEGNS